MTEKEIIEKIIQTVVVVGYQEKYKAEGDEGYSPLVYIARVDVTDEIERAIALGVDKHHNPITDVGVISQVHHKAKKEADDAVGIAYKTAVCFLESDFPALRAFSDLFLPQKSVKPLPSGGGSKTCFMKTTQMKDLLVPPQMD